MTLNEYQEKAMSTCMPTCDNFSYMFLNLVGEVGEFASKVAKGIRKGFLFIGKDDAPGDLRVKLTEDYKLPPLDFCEELMKEVGDILWQLSGLCKVMGWSLEDVAQANIDKLAARKAAGTIDGNGDGITKEERSL